MAACNFLMRVSLPPPGGAALALAIINGCRAELNKALIGDPGCTARWNSFSCCAMLVVMFFVEDNIDAVLWLLLGGGSLDGGLGTAIDVTWSSSRRAYRLRRRKFAWDATREMFRKSGGMSCAEVGMYEGTGP